MIRTGRSIRQRQGLGSGIRPADSLARASRRFFRKPLPPSMSVADDPIALQAERRILLIRSQRVMLDFDLAELYNVETRALKQAVRRNLDRFPGDFLFELTDTEVNDLVSQTVIPGRGKLGGAVPYAFTEQGVAMLSSVLRGQRAVQVNIAIMRAFVKLREILSGHTDLARKLVDMEKKYDSQFKVVFEAIRQLMTPPAKPKREIGFHTLSVPPDHNPKARIET